MDLTCAVPAAGKLEGTMTKSRSSLSWLVPDLALLAGFVTLFFCLFLFDGTRQLFRDSDAGWHIRTGEAILRGAGLPRVDPYSFSKAAAPWFAWEWGADVLSGLAHESGGLAYVAGLYAVALAIVTWLWFRLQWALGSHFLIAAMAAILMLTTANIHWHARPHVFSWALLLTGLLGIENRRGLIFFGVLSVIWTNLHASFFLLPVLLLTYAASHVLRPLIWSGFERTTEWKQARFFGLAALVSLAASLVNPYGWALHSHVIRYLGNSELLDRVGEFQSFNFHAEGAWQILLTVAVAGIGGVLALTQRRLAHFAVCSMFILMALRSARVLPIVAIVVLPLACGAITEALHTWSGLQPRLRRGLDAFLLYGENLRKLDAGFSGLALMPVIVVAVFALLGVPAVSAHAGFPPATFPLKAAEVLPANARVLAPDMFGGYMIYRFQGERKVWFDGRSDFYGSAFMKDYLRLIEVRPGWREELARWKFTHAMLPERSALIPLLESSGWQRLYSDQVATVLKAPVKVKD